MDMLWVSCVWGGGEGEGARRVILAHGLMNMSGRMVVLKITITCDQIYQSWNPAFFYSET